MGELGAVNEISGGIMSQGELEQNWRSERVPGEVGWLGISEGQSNDWIRWEWERAP